jgi:hypothetical protein
MLLKIFLLKSITISNITLSQSGMPQFSSHGRGR